jgi:1-acyl-sn-glycerol-3-phosphate acyltransferase
MRDGEAFRRFFYRVVVGSLKVFLHLGARVRIDFHGRIPPGACVLVSNHISHFDPPLLSGWIPRKIDWIAMAELFGTSWSKKGFTWLDVIPVDRKGDDRQALREALRRLGAGRMIGLFPEGGIRDGDRSILAGAPMREGAFLLAAKARCPVLPVVIIGSERLYNRRRWVPWSRATVHIAVGAPIMPPEDAASRRSALAEQTARAIIALKDRLVADHGLQPADLPRSPQERMREP